MVAVNVTTVKLPATLVERPNAAGIGTTNKIVARDSEPLLAPSRPVARESDLPRRLLYALKAAQRLVTAVHHYHRRGAHPRYCHADTLFKANRQYVESRT